MRYWVGTALLAGSWLLGVDYFYPANPYAWLAVVAAAVALLGKTDTSSQPLAVSHLRLQAIAIVLFLPAVWFASWPYRAAPLLIVLGLAIQLVPLRKRWLDWLAAGAVLAGVVMVVQALTLELYASYTAHSHELPWPLPDLLAGVATLLGIDATADGSNVVMHSMRQVHRLGATWELFLDPASLLFFVGGLTMLACRSAGETPAFSLAGETPALRAGLRTLTLVIVIWLPVRAGLLMALYMHRVLRSDPERPLHAMNHFFSPWMLLLLLIVPVLLAWRFVRILPSPAGRGAGGEGLGECSNDLSSPALTLTLSHEERGLGTEVPSPLSAMENHHSSFITHHSSFILRHSLFATGVLIALAVALFTAAIYWCPSGGRKGGRVMVVERHSKWEPTTIPYDTKWFVEPEPFPDVNSGYNYARIYRCLGQYYDMSRLLEKDKIDDETLSKCDVLIVKTPTERYSPEEAAAVTRFVEQGGGLLLIGDHTNYERSATAMNDITRPMGFIFRDDLLFSFGQSPDEELYATPAVCHPAVQHFPLMDFAVSCSIDPGFSRGRPVIESTGLWSMGPEYHFDNFLPFSRHCPAMRYGAFVQAWAAWYKAGRAIAFTDSTVFSNFCAGQPGKSELMLGMVEWLNHGNAWIDPRLWLILLGLVPLAAGLWMGTVPIFVSAKMGPSPSQHAVPVCHCLEQAVPDEPAESSGTASAKQWHTVADLPNAAGNLDCSHRAAWLVLLAAGMCGWVVASLAVVGVHCWAMPTPECVRPERCVVIDRTTSTVPLSKGAYTRGGGVGYGLFEQWLARLDCRTVRKEGSDAFSGDVLVVVSPNRSVPEEYMKKLEQYVNDGGKLLVIDSPENTNSTANRLLWPFGLSVHHDRAWKGKLSTSVKLPAVEVDRSCEVAGGQPIANLDKYPVAAVVRYGRGSVMAIGFGSLWNDTRMGESWMLEPDAVVRARFDLLFGLVGPFLDDKPWPAFPTAKPQKSNGDKDSLLKESGPADL
jgi:hypothetical protein